VEEVAPGSDSEDTELDSNYTEDVDDDVAEEERLEKEADKKLIEGMKYEESESSSSGNSDDEDVVAARKARREKAERLLSGPANFGADLAE
jgi:hypothetical protein